MVGLVGEGGLHPASLGCDPVHAIVRKGHLRYLVATIMPHRPSSAGDPELRDWLTQPNDGVRGRPAPRGRCQGLGGEHRGDAPRRRAQLADDGPRQVPGGLDGRRSVGRACALSATSDHTSFRSPWPSAIIRSSSSCRAFSFSQRRTSQLALAAPTREAPLRRAAHAGPPDLFAGWDGQVARALENTGRGDGGDAPRGGSASHPTRPLCRSWPAPIIGGDTTNGFVRSGPAPGRIRR